MSATPPEEIEEIRKHVKLYIGVFVALMILTVLTVAVSYLQFVVPLAITVALIIAVTKGSLVASFFMHLISEKRPIYWVLLFTVVCWGGADVPPAAGHGRQHRPLSGSHRAERWHACLSRASMFCLSCCRSPWR